LFQIRSFIGKRLTAEEIADAQARKLPKAPDDFRLPKRLSEVVDAYGKISDGDAPAAYASSMSGGSGQGSGEGSKDASASKHFYSSSVIAPRSGPFEWASLMGIAASNSVAPPCVPLSLRQKGPHNGSGGGSVGNSGHPCSGAVPRIPSLTGMLFMHPPSIMEAPAAMNDPLAKVKAVIPPKGLEIPRPNIRAKKATAAIKKASKVSKAAIANREGESIILAPARKSNKTKPPTVGFAEEAGGDVGLLAAEPAPKPPKMRRVATAANSSSSDRKKPQASNKSRVEKTSSEKISSDMSDGCRDPPAWTPWGFSAPNIATSSSTAARRSNNNSSGHDIHETELSQQSRMFNMSLPFASENSMALLPDTSSNLSGPPMSPSTLTSMLFAIGDGESSLNLLPLDFSMSSPAKK
jgi:hypothetical protein